MIKPRYAAGRDDVVVGYSVAERLPKGGRPVWFGGGHLAKDWMPMRTAYGAEFRQDVP